MGEASTLEKTVQGDNRRKDGATTGPMSTSGTKEGGRPWRVADALDRLRGTGAHGQ